MTRRCRWTVAGVVLAAAAAVLGLGGCSNLGYYWQSASGHLQVMNAARPVSRLRRILRWMLWSLMALAFLLALAYSQPRILAMFLPIPLFNRQLLPGMLRLAIGAGLGVMVAPTLMPAVAAAELSSVQVLMLVTKEAFVGFMLGFLVAIPFWAFEAVGFLIDNQRGASIAASLNPLTGNDSSPLGILFNQAFNVFFFISGGFLLMLELLYGSFLLWDVFAWNPTFRAESMPVMMDDASEALMSSWRCCARRVMV